MLSRLSRSTDRLVASAKRAVSGNPDLAVKMGDGGHADWVLEKALPDSSGQYGLEAVPNNSATERIDLAAEYGGSRRQVAIEIDQQQGLSFVFQSQSALKKHISHPASK